MGMSVFCDDGDDSDAHFRGFDPDGDGDGDGDADGDTDARKRTKVRRSRRKDNSPFSLRPPKLSSPNQESKSRHSSGKFLTTTEPLNPSHWTLAVLPKPLNPRNSSAEAATNIDVFEISRLTTVWRCGYAQCNS